MINSKSPFKIVFFDNDGTLTIERQSWEYMHKHLGTWEPKGRILLDHHLTNNTPYDGFAIQCVKLWKGVPRSRFLERLLKNEIRHGVVDVLRELKSAGLKTVVLSSGFSLWREVWRNRVSIEFDHYHANDLIFDNQDICTGSIEMNVTDNTLEKDKSKWVETILNIEGIPAEESIFVGDGHGDIRGFLKCAFGVAVDPESELVKASAKYTLGRDEFPKLLDIVFAS